MDVTQRLMSLKDHDCRVLMEFALNIEIQAYDLYRNMANILTEATAQDIFFSIAQMEKKHMELLAGVFKECAK